VAAKGIFVRPRFVGGVVIVAWRRGDG